RGAAGRPGACGRLPQGSAHATGVQCRVADTPSPELTVVRTGHGRAVLMGVGHDHGHAHGAPAGGTASAAYRGRLRAALAITLGVMVVQIVGGLLADSLALVADAAHMATDAVGLGVALLAIHFANRPPSERRTFGLARAEILAALANCLLLLVVGGYVLYEAVERFVTPADTKGGVALVFGAIGLAANLVSLMLLMRGQKESLNVRGAFLEVAAD